MPGTSHHLIEALSGGNVAVITGGANGIGRAAALKLASMGMRVAIADRSKENLDETRKAIAEGGAKEDAVLTANLDVVDADAVSAFAKKVAEWGGAPTILMNNAGISPDCGKPWEKLVDWHKLIDVNFWGIVNGAQAFTPGMLASGRPGFIINTGSKQGITTPPGNLAYNVSKSAVKTYTEGLAHELRNTGDGAVSAHLLIPGFTYTGLTRKSDEKPAAAWTGEQVVDFMLERLAKDDFYILCPDNDVTREMDEKRMAWAIGDIIENRPALSRWHPDYAEAFKSHMEG